MPRGIPKSGFRKTKNYKMRQVMKTGPVAPTIVETEEEVYQKLKDRFAAMDTMTEATAKGKNRSLIISGPAGLGKSYGVMKMIDGLEKDGYNPVVIRGFVRPTGLYKTLYEFRHENCVVVFDDADSIFSDEDSLNLLKTACDMTEKRTLSWLTETRMEDEDGEKLPRRFDFNGSVIFITNYDFDAMIAGGTKLAPHFEAMISRSHYLDLSMKTTLDYIVRIKQVVKDHGMLKSQGFSLMQETVLLSFIQTNQAKLRELSLRMVLKLAGLMKMNPTGWEKLAKVTCMR
jgi:hypothetical protein